MTAPSIPLMFADNITSGNGQGIEESNRKEEFHRFLRLHSLYERPTLSNTMKAWMNAYSGLQGDAPRTADKEVLNDGLVIIDVYTAIITNGDIMRNDIGITLQALAGLAALTHLRGNPMLEDALLDRMPLLFESLWDNRRLLVLAPYRMTMCMVLWAYQALAKDRCAWRASHKSHAARLCLFGWFHEPSGRDENQRSDSDKFLLVLGLLGDNTEDKTVTRELVHDVVVNALGVGEFLDRVHISTLGSDLTDLTAPDGA